MLGRIFTALLWECASAREAQEQKGDFFFGGAKLEMSGGGGYIRDRQKAKGKKY